MVHKYGSAHNDNNNVMNGKQKIKNLLTQRLILYSCFESSL